MKRDDAPPAALWMIAFAALAPFPTGGRAYGWGPPDVARPALTVDHHLVGGDPGVPGRRRWGLESAADASALAAPADLGAVAGVAWTMLLSRGRIDNTWIIGGCIGAFLVQWLFDHHGPDVPARYPKLSTALTAAACISLAVCLDQAMK